MFKFPPRSTNFNKKFILFPLIVFYSLLFLSCNSNNYNRNHLNFKSSSINVKSSMKKVNKLIMEIDCNEHYGYNFHSHGYLYICGKMIPYEKENTLKSFPLFKNFNRKKFNEFIHEITFLNDHQIYSCYFDKDYNAFFYSYIRSKEVTSNLYRAIMLESELTDKIMVTFNILDQKDGLVLLQRK